MIINKKRVNKIDKLLILIGNNSFIVQAKVKDVKLLEDIGFKSLDINTSTIPNEIGSVSRYNLYGKEVIITPRSREYVTHTMPYEVKDWHGNWHSGYYDRTFERYKRKFLEAPEDKITISSLSDDTYIITSKIMTPNDSKDSIKHNINLMLEAFKTVEIVKSDGSPFTNEKHVPWVILPPGEYPWSVFYQTVKHSLNNINNDDLIELRNRYEFLQQLKPICTISGKNGFLGYYITQFSNGIYICDSVFKNNAIYIFDSNWEQLSMLTKKEIISGQLAIERIIHQKNWKSKVINLLKKFGALTK